MISLMLYFVTPHQRHTEKNYRFVRIEFEITPGFSVRTNLSPAVYPALMHKIGVLSVGLRGRILGELLALGML